MLERANVVEPSIYAAIGFTYLRMLEVETSLQWSEKALALDPDCVNARINASVACRLLHRMDDAKVHIDHALKLDPTNGLAVGALAAIQANQKQISHALANASLALQMNPDCLDAIATLAYCYAYIGDIETAMPFYRDYLRRSPNDSSTSSGMLFSMHYMPGLTRDEFRAAHKAWGDRFAARFKSSWPQHANDRNPDRRLRLGYISGDLRHHVVGYWTRHIIEAHNRENFEVFCYANNKEDDYSAQIKAAADHWRNIQGKPDDDVARLIQDDKIDILVDLSGHTAGHRLLVMARKPAPVQATWCGYIDSTGLEAIDYVITDEITTPVSEPSPFIETPLRLSCGSVCFEQIAIAPEVGPLPYLRKGHITFGCFSNPSKIGSQLIQVWSEILKRTPDSKLMLTYNTLGDPFTRARILKIFEDNDISEDRVLLRRGRREAALQAYSDEVDIALDTFPYTGGTTTCEALWMGVPVVALYGDHPMSRFSCSLLAYAGLPALTTNTVEEYIDRAVTLAGQPDTIAHLRQSLRGHLTQTPLFDNRQFLNVLEEAYRDIFAQWCDQQSVAKSNDKQLVSAN
jgi:predicted O-linked N-acetylglucosamine transferase (SPINDLY family)